MRLTRALGICISTTKASSWGEILESMASGLLMEATILGFLQAAHLSFQVFPRYYYLPYVIHSIKHSFPLRLDMYKHGYPVTPPVTLEQGDGGTAAPFDTALHEVGESMTGLLR
ncbi:hypothetical protein D8674_013335 [Pyrus ussuriensis x Pyrus communis]|uniref:Uncharacterized protein n=1 Tax=Pyrus ussuriensis x Pyrus communis TaxID=2448454 RepID=A0A5N5GPE6_9ROSA|nr:hypothetical protein D8674_013335 [Pyrus ussuriensis x Pyrus communis]